MNIAPVIYLEPFYEQYKEGRMFQNILFKIADIYLKKSKTENFDVAKVRDYEAIKDSIRIKLVNKELNGELSDVPHKQVEDLTAVYYIDIGPYDDDMASIRITDKIMEIWNVTPEELHSVAIGNMERNKDFHLSSLTDILFGMMGSDMINSLDISEEEARELFEQTYLPPNVMQVCVLTNERKIFGASEILNPAAIEAVSEKFGNKFGVIPSSIHEVLIVPYTNDMDVHFYEDVISEVNETQLSEEEVLSNRMYIMDAKANKLMRLDKYMEKEKEAEKKQEIREADLGRKPRGPKL